MAANNNLGRAPDFRDEDPQFVALASAATLVASFEFGYDSCVLGNDVINIVAEGAELARANLGLSVVIGTLAISAVTYLSKPTAHGNPRYNPFAWRPWGRHKSDSPD